MIFYITYNDAPSGIYSSQVIDVVKFLNVELKADVKLVSFISMRNYFKNRSKIKKELPEAIVIPMVPGIHRWRCNLIFLYFLCLLFNPKLIIGRSVFATQLALKCKKGKMRIVYDGRGAIAAEWKEYKVVTNSRMLSEISLLEKEVVLNADYRVAVSNNLLEYWRQEYGYTSHKHVVIPCTLNKVFENIELNSEIIVNKRKSLNMNSSDIVFVYSGSIAGWQSFDLLYKFISPILKSFPNSKLLFLSDRDSNIVTLENEFPNRILQKMVSPQNVPEYLMIADYGLLIREQSVTNRVASPVKFPEYLSCGLKIIISEHLGDYSEFVSKNQCGYLHKDFHNEHFSCLSPEERQINQMFALNHFVKSHFLSSYKILINN